MSSRPPAKTDLRRLVPAVEQVLRHERVRELENRYGRALLVRHVRSALEEIRGLGTAADETGVEAAVSGLDETLARRLEAAAAPSLVPVINATGVVIHTN